MPIDIKTEAVEEKRITFDHIARKLGEGKKPNRYQEAVFGHQPEEVFHYRPTWDPEHELFDVRRTAIQMQDFEDLIDPRQYFYATFVIQRSKQQESQEKNYSVVEKRGLLDNIGDELRENIKKVVVPFRHAEWGANTNNFYISSYGYQTPITSAATMQGMDRLGNAQYLTRIGLILSGNDPAILDEAKELWLNDPMWQGMRKVIEDSFVIDDWFELHLLQNYLLDGVFQPLLFQHLENHIVTQGGAAFAMLTEFFIDWYGESCRWADATIKVALDESDQNRILMQSWMEKWRPEVVAAAQILADAVFSDQSDSVMASILDELDARSKKIGLLT